MNTRRFTLLLLLAVATSTLHAADAKLRYVPNGEDTTAVVVSGSLPLVHTGQILSPEPAAGVVLAALDHFIAQAGGDPKRVVKLNVVATTQDIAEELREFVRHKYPAEARPAVSFVIGALPKQQKIGVDAVALVKPDAPSGESSAARTLPAGPRVYVSGQAEKGATPADAAAKTIASLLKTLETVQSSKSAVVQAKCFLTPMSAAPDVMAEFAKVFGAQKLPLVFVEWKSDLPIEIELIAAAAPAKTDTLAIQYLTPPGMKPSPLFARVVRINRGDVIYTAGLYSEQPGTGEEQVLSIFNQLQRILKDNGGDLLHLAKATYYVSDDDASAKLNAIRPEFYDPQRPPAASKAMVNDVGMKDRSIEIDMIGVSTNQATTKP
jgi:enamine deaminase RidA (YjgF/YER057c/UK114 family)